MTDQSDILPVNQSMGGVSDQLTGIPLHFPAERRWLIAMLFASLLLLLFMISVVALFARGVGIWGINIPVNWAFAIHNYVWWLGIGHAGTLISALLLLTQSEWRNSLNRFAETMTLFAVVCAGIYPVLHLGRPWYLYWMFPYPATMNVWPQFRSPLEWDIWAVLTYLTVSFAFWYTGLIPDLAAARDRATKRSWQIFFGIISLGWRGSAAHWLRWSQAYRLTAGLAVPLVVSVHSEVSLLFAAGQIPGWHSTIFPPYFVLGAAFSGFAVVSIIAISLRSWFGLKNLVTDDHLDLLGIVLLATGLMTAYGYVFEVFDALYAGDAHELQTLADRMTGAYAWTYWGAIVFNFIPLQALWWKAVRRTGWALMLISISVAIGMWLERYMILVTSLYRDFLVSSWGSFTPTFWDWSTYFGTIGLFLVPFLLAIRFIPMISIFETEELLHEEKEESMAERAYGLLAEFDSPEALTAAAKKAREAGYRRLDAFTPFPVEGLARILRLPRPRISWVGLIGGASGCSFAFLMQCYTNYDFPLNVGGRPLYPFSAFAVVMFELTILCSALSMIIAMLWQNGLPRLNYPLFSAPNFRRASKDRFFLCVGADDGKFEKDQTTGFLRELGASSVELVTE